MKTVILLLVLCFCPILSAQTIDVQNGTHQFGETWSAPTATNGTDYASEGVVVQVSGITPDVKPLGSTAPYSTCTAVINPGGINGLTVTRQQISPTEVHFIVGGIPNDVAGPYNVRVQVTITRYYASAPTVGVPQGFGATLEMQLTGTQPGGSGGGGDGGESSSSGGDEGCSTSSGTSWIPVLLALTCLAALTRKERYDNHRDRSSARN